MKLQGLKKEKEIPEWKKGKTKEGNEYVKATRDRIKPNKYLPKKGKTLKAPPCFNLCGSGGGLYSMYKCKACMWRLQCVVYPLTQTPISKLIE